MAEFKSEKEEMKIQVALPDSFCLLPLNSQPF
jgi:hypothetical protein